MADFDFLQLNFQLLQGNVLGKKTKSYKFGSKVIANITDKQIDIQTNKQTGQKQYAPDYSIWGHKDLHLDRAYTKVIQRF